MKIIEEYLLNKSISRWKKGTRTTKYCANIKELQEFINEFLLVPNHEDFFEIVVSDRKITKDLINITYNCLLNSYVLRRNGNLIYNNIKSSAILESLVEVITTILKERN